MLFAHLLFYLLLPHALGSASTVPAQIALCAILAFILAYYYSNQLRSKDTVAFLNYLVVPTAIIALLSNTSKSEEWTLHIATIMLPMVLTPIG